MKYGQNYYQKDIVKWREICITVNTNWHHIDFFYFMATGYLVNQLCVNRKVDASYRDYKNFCFKEQYKSMFHVSYHTKE